MPRFGKGRSFMNEPDSVLREALRWLRFSEEDLVIPFAGNLHFLAQPINKPNSGDLVCVQQRSPSIMRA